jgi:uncharacterized membrane protein (DUF106 family)
MTSEFSFVLQFLDSIFLQNDLFGIRKGPLGSADPIIKGMLPSALGILGISIMLNLFNAAVRRKLVDRDKLKRITKETRAWQKERMAAFRSKDKEKIADVNKKSSYMNKLSMEMMQMNMRPMLITFVPLILIFYLVLPVLFSHIVALSPISLNIIPGDFFHLTCTAAQAAEPDNVCAQKENALYLWAWYFLSSIAFSGIIMKLTKTSMDLS